MITTAQARAAVITLIMATTACTPLTVREPRLAKSSLGCIQAAVKKLDKDHRSDSELHCTAAGLIARYCSVTEATLASVGKELRDLLGSGDAEWRDLMSDRRGVNCARSAKNDGELQQCCGG